MHAYIIIIRAYACVYYYSKKRNDCKIDVWSMNKWANKINRGVHFLSIHFKLFISNSCMQLANSDTLACCIHRAAASVIIITIQYTYMMCPTASFLQQFDSSFLLCFISPIITVDNGCKICPRLDDNTSISSPSSQYDSSMLSSEDYIIHHHYWLT